MSHSVVITRTTTTSSGTAVFLNTGYMSSLGGILKFFQTVLGAVCTGLVGYYVDRDAYGIVFIPRIFFLLMAVTFLITTFCILLSSLLSISSASILPKTLFEVIYHLLGFALLLAASLTLLIKVADYKRSYIYEPILAASIIGLVNSGLYLFSTILAFRSYRGIGI
ncbi:uncharacterized protein LOC134530125 [Bacillus rossius redtenbacheri]|uniref:uncharacterized protein LOC134530125 n=1 Tax=Bacillus rossius redtenbacheri TaxID=93214 RepID=UPI002FDDECD4